MTKRRGTHVGPGYWRDVAGQLRRAQPDTPDVVVCRRVADYPLGLPPVGARLLACAECSAPIASDPQAPHPERPRICMQCCGIEPLPFSSRES